MSGSFFTGERHKGSRAAFKEVFHFDVLVMRETAAVEGVDICSQLDCAQLGMYTFPDATGGCDMFLCEDHKLRGMVHREDLDPFGEQQTLIAGDENCFLG